MKPKNSCLLHFARYFLTRLSEGCFWQRVHRCKKIAYIWNVTSSGRAEIEHVNYASGNIFNFSSATRACFSTLTPLFPSMDKLSKNTPRNFDTLCIKKFRRNFASCRSGILKENPMKIILVKLCQIYISWPCQSHWLFDTLAATCCMPNFIWCTTRTL